MTKNKAHNAVNYTFNCGEPVLVDANVWLFLYPPTAQPPKPYTSAYSAAFKNLVIAKAEPVLDALILSEYLNRYWQIEWRAWEKLNPTLARTYPKAKDFRRSPYFTPIAQSAIAEANSIKSLCGVRETPLQLTDINDLLNEFAAGTFDFNDGVMLETCRLRGWKMLTDDGDMTKGGIEVLTANQRLISACR